MFTLFNQSMFSLISSDANNAQGLMRHEAPKKQNHPQHDDGKTRNDT